MSGKVAEIEGAINPQSLARNIANKWDTHHRARAPWLAEKSELRNYLFATDTSTTTNSSLPWKNSTTLPKLCQLRDNLHANYLSALMPNDNWVQWIAHSPSEDMVDKQKAIEAYISNKLRMGGARQVMSELLLDYIDWGMAFADVEYVNQTKTFEDTGETVQGFVGPRVVRISPNDIVFNNTASRFEDTYKIVRSIKNIGELILDAEENPEAHTYRDALDKCINARRVLGGYSSEDIAKATGYLVDGFGSLQEYYQSDFVELLSFEGDIFDTESGKLLRNRRITIVDRSYVLEDVQLPNWSNGSTIRCVGWRSRPDNLMAMGPLDNLVGMQYRIDHLENLKADVFDLIACPPMLIEGDVREINWGPGEFIHVEEGGRVTSLAPDATALNADMQIQVLEAKMEEFCGAPSEAMGVRTPGEKTAFEVQQLQNAAGRIFQEKITNFEINLLEPIVNNMLELARRNLDVFDTVRIMDDDLGVAEFMQITKEDITSSGVIRPVGARHYAAQSQLIQNVVGILGSSAGQLIQQHISGKKLSRMIEDAMGLERFNLIQPNIMLFEQQETNQLAQQLQEELAVDGMTDEGDDTAVEDEEEDFDDEAPA